MLWKKCLLVRAVESRFPTIILWKAQFLCENFSVLWIFPIEFGHVLKYLDWSQSCFEPNDSSCIETSNATLSVHVSYPSMILSCIYHSLIMCMFAFNLGNLSHKNTLFWSTWQNPAVTQRTTPSTTITTIAKQATDSCPKNKTDQTSRQTCLEHTRNSFQTIKTFFQTFEKHPKIIPRSHTTHLNAF